MSAYTVTLAIGAKRATGVQDTSSMAQAARNAIAAAVAQRGGAEPQAITVTVAQVPGELVWESAETELEADERLG